MKMQKKTNVAGEWAKKGEDIKDGDTIASAGDVVSGEYGDRTVFKVDTRNGVKNLSLNQTSQNNLIDAYGDESDKWVGKSAKVYLIRALVSGKMQQVVYLAHPEAEMIVAKDGSFNFHIGKKDDIQLEEEEINPDDIPF
jgi:hypothetical protein